MGCEVCKQTPTAQVSEETSDLKPGGSSGAALGKTLEFLAKVKLFKRLPQEFHPVLASACVPTIFPQGSVLIKQGDQGAEFYVVVSGQVSVSVGGNKVATLSVGDYFGEIALLRNEPRNATITADTHVSTLMITRDKFRELELNEKIEFPKRQAVAGGAERKLVTKPPTPKTADDKRTIVQGLKANANLNTIVTMDDARCNAMIEIAWEEVVEPEKDIITQGDENADYFYVVKQGSFEIILAKNNDGQSAETAAESNAQRVGSIGKGGSFGELALLYFAPRAATIRAKSRAVVWVFDRQNFKSILAKSHDENAKEYAKYLEKNSTFDAMQPDEKLEMAKSLTETSFAKGEFLFEQGEKGTTFFILYDGEVAMMSKDGKETDRRKGSPNIAQFFGANSLIKEEKRPNTLKVVSETAKCLIMDKVSFELLLGPLEAIQKRGINGESMVGKGGVAANPAAAKKTETKEKIFRKDLSRVGLLGCGGFGAVELVEHRVTKETYALKALSKGYVVKCGMTKGVMREKDIQIMCDSPFIVKLYETYNGEQSLYFLLEPALGGELYATYNRKGFHGSEPHAKFYIAGTVYAFEHLHEKKIIFRDLKPENLLLTDKGAIKLTDMGLAKVVVGKTYTTCGTPDYFAPELIASTGHTHSVDWWTLGVLTFELMSGHPPFESAAPMQIYSKVTKGINKVTFPAKLKGAGEDLVKGLCKKEPHDRLPMKKGGIANVQKHDWYASFDWTKMKNGKLQAPYIPKVKSKKDIANFSARKEDMPPQVKYKADGTGWDNDFATST